MLVAVAVVVAAVVVTVAVVAVDLVPIAVLVSCTLYLLSYLYRSMAVSIFLHISWLKQNC